MESFKYRQMRLILMFDLPTDDDIDKKIYSKFKKDIFKLGYTMIQYSVYVKCVNSQSKVQQEVDKINKSLPKRGNIRIIAITEAQYEKMYILRGKRKLNEIYNNERRYVKI